MGVLLLLLILMSLQVRRGDATLLEHALFRASTPVVRLASGTLSTARHAWEGYVDLQHVSRINGELQRRMQQLEVEHQELEELRRENLRLRALLGLRERRPMAFTAARVIANQASGPGRTLLLDQGRSAGVERNMPVVVAEGIVGRVILRDAGESKVQLIIDADSAVAVRIARTGLRGTLKGRGGETLRLHYVPAQEDVRVGDCLVTSGYDRIYPEGLQVGCVLRVSSPSAPVGEEGGGPLSGLMMDIEVRPAVNFARLREVLLLRNPETADPSPAAAAPGAEP